MEVEAGSELELGAADVPDVLVLPSLLSRLVVGGEALEGRGRPAVTGRSWSLLLRLGVSESQTEATRMNRLTS